MSEEQTKNGMPSDASLKSPYESVNESEAGTETEVEQKPKSIMPILIILFVFLLLLTGAVLTAVQYLNTPNEKSKISLSEDKKAPAVSVETTDDNTPPPLTTIAENTTENLSGYEITGNDEPLDNGISVDQFNLLMTRLEAIESSLADANNGISENNGIVRSVRDNTDTLKDGQTAIISGTEAFASKLNTQFTQVEQVKNMLSTESERSKKNSAKTPFRVAAKSIWGNVVYLTVATENNFEQQTAIGGTVSGWTLTNVDLMKKISVWKNINGDRYELDLP